MVWLFNTLASIIRGTGNMRVPSMALIGAAVLQIALGGVLGLGFGLVPRLGMPGVALGQILAQAVGAAGLFWYLRSGRGRLRLSFGGVPIRRELFGAILKVGAVACLSPLQSVTTMLLMAGFVAQLGVLPLAGFAIGQRLEFLMSTVAFGIGLASVPMVGMAIGAGQVARARRVAWTAAGVTAAILGAVGLVVALHPDLWVTIFTRDPQVLDYGRQFLRWSGPAFAFFGVGLTLYFASQGAGRMAGPVFAATMRLLLVAVGGSVLVAHGASAWQLFALSAASMVVYGSTCAAALKLDRSRGAARCSQHTAARRSTICTCCATGRPTFRTAATMGHCLNQERPCPSNPPPRCRSCRHRLTAFMDKHIYPHEKRHVEEAEALGPWKVLPVIEELKPKARAAGLWNLFLPASEHGAGLTNLEYAPLCEIMGRSLAGAGGLQLLRARHRQHGSAGALRHARAAGAVARAAAGGRDPLLLRDDRAATWPRRDATNIESPHRARRRRLRHQRPQVVDLRRQRPALQDRHLHGQDRPDNADRHKQQSMILVPMDTPGVNVRGCCPCSATTTCPHGASEVTFENVRVPASNILLGEGRGFEIAQGRLGPGRIHHCMRLIGLAERALEAMCRARSIARRLRQADRRAGRDAGADIAESRIEIEQARLLTLKAAYMMDTVGNKAARAEIAMIKVVAPNMASRVIDRAIQAHGGGGTSNDFGLADAYAMSRVLRLADGPDEVHREQIGKMELRKYR